MAGNGSQNVTEYRDTLDVKIKGKNNNVLESTESNAKQNSHQTESIELENTLYSELVKFRTTLAHQCDCKPNMIPSDKMLIDVAKLKPKDVSILKNIEGFTDAIVEHFGEALVNRVAEIKNAFQADSKSVTVDTVNTCVTNVFTEAPPIKKFQDRIVIENDWIQAIFNTGYFEVEDVLPVNNPCVQGLYLLYKEELECDGTTVEEHMLYHATSRNNAKSIACNNIDWRMTVRTRYGKGAYFCYDPFYADRFSKRATVQAFVVCRVLMKKSEKTSVFGDWDVPSCVEYDSAVVDYCGKKCTVVKFDDYNFCPIYVVYYKRIKRHIFNFI